jgi:hypothetical protein
LSEHFALLQFVNERVVMKQYFRMHATSLFEIAVRLKQFVRILLQLFKVSFRLLQVVASVELAGL